MSRVPRLLPLIGVAIGGVIAVNVISGADSFPQLLAATQAFAEEALPKAAPGPKTPAVKPGPLPPGGAGAAVKTPAPAGPAVCAPTAAELAREAGLSPAELQMLQSLGARRGQLEQREKDFELQLALIAAAETKLEQRIAAMNALKGEINGLLGQADTKQAAEVDRMVAVFSTMAQQKPRDAAARLAVLEDEIRLPIVAKMSPRNLSAVLANMSPADAKRLTEALSRRFQKEQMDASRQRLSQVTAPTPKAAPPAAAPKAGPRPPAVKAASRPATNPAPPTPAPKAPARPATPEADAPAAPQVRAAEPPAGPEAGAG